jgi:hypothetical protein
MTDAEHDADIRRFRMEAAKRLFAQLVGGDILAITLTLPDTDTTDYMLLDLDQTEALLSLARLGKLSIHETAVAIHALQQP